MTIQTYRYDTMTRYTVCTVRIVHICKKQMRENCKYINITCIGVRKHFKKPQFFLTNNTTSENPPTHMI